MRHPKLSLFTIYVVAVLSGARSFAAIAQWVRAFTQSELERLRCRRDPRSRRYMPPCALTIRRFLHSNDAAAVDTAVGAWLQVLDQGDRGAVAIDGKTIRGARRKDGRQVYLLSAVAQSMGTTVAQVEVGQYPGDCNFSKNVLCFA
jgi:hypothetical protein